MNRAIKLLSGSLAVMVMATLIVVSIWRMSANAGTESPATPGTATQLHLSWTQDPSDSFTITWHTPAPNNRALVDYRPLGSETWASQSGTSRASPGRGYLHTTAVTGLKPATDYEYRVSNDDGASPAMSGVYRTRTAPKDRNVEFQLAFISDTGIAGRLDGNANGTRRVIEAIAADDPLFILGGGDYAYANFDPRFSSVGEAIDAWFVQMEALFARMPFMAQYGNHEVSLVEDFADWAPRFALPSGSGGDHAARYDVAQALEERMSYSFDVGPVHFTGLFVPQPFVEPERLIWLDRDLSTARARGARWLVVYQHEPIFGHGHVHPADPRVRGALTPVLEKHGVDLHLSAHDQSYERTYPLTGLPHELSIGSLSAHDYRHGDGVIYVKVSPSGKMSERRGDFSRFDDEQPPFMAARHDSMHHYALITVQGDERLRVEVFGVDDGGRAKHLVDQFEISRTGSPYAEPIHHDLSGVISDG